MLTFTDSQIKETTGQMLAAPAKLESQAASQANAANAKAGYLDLDKANAIYTDQYLAIIQAYHDEYKLISGIQKTITSEASITAGGKLDSGNTFFPDASNPPIWQKFQPFLAPEVLGNPTTTYAATEQAAWTPLQNYITLLETGFTSGSASTAFTLGTSTTVSVLLSTGFSVGDKVIIFDTGSGWVYGTINLITAGIPPAATLITYDTVSSGGTLGSTGTIANHDGGFSMAQRENGGVSGGRGAYLTGLKTSIDTQVTTWAANLTSQLTALNTNQDTVAPGPANVTTAKTNVTTAKSTITTWQARPATGTGLSRYGAYLDNDIVPLISTRTSQISVRTPQIPAALGTVTQAPDGTYTGSGFYFKLFGNIDLRLNKTGGTLRQYYQQDLVGAAFAQQTSLTKGTTSRDAETFLVKIFQTDADGTNVIQLADVNSLTNGESVKIITNTQPVITTTISSITGQKVQLAASVPNTYTVADQARLVVQLA